MALLVALPFSAQKESPEIPVAHAAVPLHLPAAGTAVPMRLSIPSINLNDQVVPVGVNALGQMDVPPGNTKEVGWYAGGTAPGDIGSAVLDAHVFAAFANLSKLKAGDDLYIETTAGATQHFKVTATHTYPLADVSADALFNGTGARELNLITCAGTYLPAQGTYDHRLIVYATLAN
ncbi:MAG: class F sortase [Minisyncoccia bacterium]